MVPKSSPPLPTSMRAAAGKTTRLAPYFLTSSATRSPMAEETIPSEVTRLAAMPSTPRSSRDLPCRQASDFSTICMSPRQRCMSAFQYLDRLHQERGPQRENAAQGSNQERDGKCYRQEPERSFER